MIAEQSINQQELSLQEVTSRSSIAASAQQRPRIRDRTQNRVLRNRGSYPCNEGVMYSSLSQHESIGTVNERVSRESAEASLRVCFLQPYN